MLRTTAIPLLVVLIGLAGCAISRPAALPPSRAAAPDRDAIRVALAERSRPTRRQFTATLRVADRTSVLRGVFDFHSAYDFRLTALAGTGTVLFDVRYDWAGIHVLRAAAGCDRDIVEGIAKGMSMAFRVPRSLSRLDVQAHVSELSFVSGEQYVYTYDFAGVQGRLRTLAVQRGTFDTLEVQFPSYDAQGWPRDITLYRPALGYSLSLTFTAG